MKKTRDLLIILGIYLLAFLVGWLACIPLEGILLQQFVFDVVATVIVFAFSVLLHNSSVYDPYWSLTPMLMAVWLFAAEGAWSLWQILFLGAFLLWGLRLTQNWVRVFTDFSYEDWRYRKYREETPRIFWPAVNFFGIHLMPTLVVFAGMLPMYAMARQTISWAVIPGTLVMLWGVGLEFFADRQMHAFLQSKSGGVCSRGLWNYSRHPNYLGEISFWWGVFLACLPFISVSWVDCLGFISVTLLFNVVSVPLMEKRQLARRPQYRDYQKTTSRLLLWPKKRRKGA